MISINSVQFVMKKALLKYWYCSDDDLFTKHPMINIFIKWLKDLSRASVKVSRTMNDCIYDHSKMRFADEYKQVHSFPWNVTLLTSHPYCH